MLKNKDAPGFLTPFAHKIASLHAVPIPGHDHHDPAELSALAAEELGVGDARPSDELWAAVKQVAETATPASVLICGSLYLAGEVLKANNQVPD
jgi:dihydrofolate synthase/folylpolyglutamate synthase